EARLCKYLSYSQVFLKKKVKYFGCFLLSSVIVEFSTGQGLVDIFRFVSRVFAGAATAYGLGNLTIKEVYLK
ncbi:unnamed protein product, partial [Brassica oleracea]